MPRKLFIGRWQPFHRGHKFFIEMFLQQGHEVCIAIRATPISKDNPFSVAERMEMIRKEFPDRRKVVIIEIPDVDEVVIGRNIGYTVVQVPERISMISATEIRKEHE